jgi:3-oxoacyl-(acyl-carrier-protein) synthase
MRKIYVTGLGVISGIGKGVEENLDSLKAGKHGMGKITPPHLTYPCPK